MFFLYPGIKVNAWEALFIMHFGKYGYVEVDCSFFYLILHLGAVFVVFLNIERTLLCYEISSFFVYV